MVILWLFLVIQANLGLANPVTQLIKRLKTMQTFFFTENFLEDSWKSVERFWKDSGRILGGFCEDSGKDSGRILEGFWEDSGRILVRILEGFWKDSERILEGFWWDSGRILEGFWKDSGRILKPFWKDYGVAWLILGSIG